MFCWNSCYLVSTTCMLHLDIFFVWAFPYFSINNVVIHKEPYLWPFTRLVVKYVYYHMQVSSLSFSFIVAIRYERIDVLYLIIVNIFKPLFSMPSLQSSQTDNRISQELSQKFIACLFWTQTFIFKESAICFPLVAFIQDFP